MLILAAGISYTCINEYLSVEGSASGILCIDGSLVKNREVQQVIITRSIGKVDDNIPYVKGCDVYVEDEMGNTRNFTEVSQGIYEATIGDDFLVINRQYRLNVKTTGGEIYISDYELLLDCPEVDSIYFLYEDNYSYQRNMNITGLQFYLDLKVKEGYTKYYRWTLREDWEYKIPYGYYGYWDGETLFRNIADLSTCYDNSNISYLFSASTENLANTTIKKKIPLSFINPNSAKLRYRYSLLVKQYSLTPEAYAYWQQKKVDIQEAGELYTAQPGQDMSNITNITDNKDVVLGYFWVATEKEKPFFINYPLNYLDHLDCNVQIIDSVGIYLIDIIYDEVDKSYTLVYDTTLYYRNEYDSTMVPLPRSHIGYDLERNIVWPIYYNLPGFCLDCRKHGGDTAMPYYWK